MKIIKKFSYFFKISLFIGVGLVYFFGLVTAADGYDICNDFFRGFFCGSEECSISGQVRCYDRNYKQICGNYDSDSNLEWSFPQLCSGNTSCGYGNCASNQRPKWYCSLGGCTYSCDYDSSCKTPSCECSEGPCCDGCHYKLSTAICDFENQTQYGCPWGSLCGADVGKRIRTKFRYCSGNNSQCAGDWSDWTPWIDWLVSDYCSSDEVCLTGNFQCQSSSSCIQPISTYIKHYKKACYDSDLYWFDSNDLRQEKYQECSDNNSCTIDGCENNTCFNNLKCDGTTCELGSKDYCENCEHCGDGLCNCEETKYACSQDCSSLTVAILGKKETDSGEWKEKLDVKSGEKLDFLMVVFNGGQETLDDIVTKAQFPQEISYKGDLKIGGESNSGDIINGVNIGSLKPNTIKIITFKGEIKPTEKNSIAKNEINIVGTALSKGLSASVSMAISPGEVLKTTAAVGLSLRSIFKKWYYLFLALLIIILLVFFFKRFFFSSAT